MRPEGQIPLQMSIVQERARKQYLSLIQSKMRVGTDGHTPRGDTRREIPSENRAVLVYQAEALIRVDALFIGEQDGLAIEGSYHRFHDKTEPQIWTA